MNFLLVDTIRSSLPADARIKEISFEGSEIILYTDNKEFFRSSSDLIRSIVSKVKKRIEVRCDPSILSETEKTETLIREIVPKDAGIKDIYFEPEFAKVVIHAEKPGLVIGKGGETLIKIKNETLWTPDVKRAPIIDSEVIRSIRRMLHKESKYRKKFLNALGEKIYTPGKPTDWIRLTMLGSFREVGRSCVFLQTPQSKVLLDCGISVSSVTKPYPYLDVPEFNIQELDAIVLSHAHLDHSGMIPYLFEYGYRGPLYCTRPTRDLAALLQLDYIKVCQRENKKPPYSSKGIEEMIKHSIALEYSEVSDITPDMRLTLNNAGHILGSATVHVHIGDGLYNVLYTGDIKYENTKLLERTYTDYARLEALIIEATYGGDNSPTQTFAEGERDLVAALKTVIARGGKTLIPAFAVGRAQDIIAILTQTDIEVPMYLDGMLWDATAIYPAYTEFLSRNLQTMILHKGVNPFVDPRLKGIGSSKERQAVFDNKEPCIVISTSGMLNGGPAIEYLQRFCEDSKNALIFVGYQGEGTMGRRIQKGWKDIQLENGKTLQLNMEIITIHGLSDHSTQRQLINFVSFLKKKPKRVIINHGENTNCLDFARLIHNKFRTETTAPKNLETIRLL